MTTAYIRNKEGQTYELPVKEALEEFFSDKGYRITISSDGEEVTMWNSWDRDMIRDEKYMECLVTITNLI